MKICYIGGESYNWAWVLMQNLAFEGEGSYTKFMEGFFKQVRHE
jgi:hypothetical protein